jgi:uncharacterized surface protein with fasciclin (FAS1) repeats
MMIRHMSLLTGATGLALAATTFLVMAPVQAETMMKPAAPVQAKPTAKPAMEMAATGTIVDVAVANGSFNTLVAAVKAAGLAETLSGKGPFTVFAPTDAAFAALPKGTVEKLLKPENKAKLVKVLTYHVVAGKVESKTLKSGQVKTVEGAAVAVKVAGGKVMINRANVIQADVPASNGVIHVIDHVLLPPGLKL